MSNLLANNSGGAPLARKDHTHYGGPFTDQTNLKQPFIKSPSNSKLHDNGQSMTKRSTDFSNVKENEFDKKATFNL